MVYKCLFVSLWGCNVDYSLEYLAYVSHSNNKWWKMSCKGPEKRFPKECESWQLIKQNKTYILLIVGVLMIFCIMLLYYRHCSCPVCRGSWEALYSWYCDATTWIWCHLSHTQRPVWTHFHIFFSTLHSNIIFYTTRFFKIILFSLNTVSSSYLNWFCKCLSIIVFFSSLVKCILCGSGDGLQRHAGSR